MIHALFYEFYVLTFNPHDPHFTVEEIKAQSDLYKEIQITEGRQELQTKCLNSFTIPSLIPWSLHTNKAENQMERISQVSI